MLTTAAFGAIGFADDYLKIVAPLAPRPAAALQDGRGRSLVALGRRRGAARAGDQRNLYSTRLIFPFFKRLIPDLGWCYVPFAVLVLVGASQRGEPDRRPRRPRDQHLRGRGRRLHRAGLRDRAPRVRRVPAARALPAGRRADDLLRRRWSARASASSGTTRYPAEIFMGDVGSLALGGALGTVAILIKQELLLVDRRRRVRDRGAVGHHPGRVVQADGRSACSRWRRCTTTSS